MAFLKYANAQVVQPGVSFDSWVGHRSGQLGAGSIYRVKTAADRVLQKFDPEQHLLTHCTIVASVDTENAGLPLGRQMVEGFQIDRRYDDFIVSAKTQPWINNNHDCWERKLLLASFPTFIGGQNYLEHLQIPEMSKGRIIDAAARDIGDSLYIDILIATDRKHKDLVASIESKRVSTLSMGCTILHSTCTKCGNTAEDETQLCKHIRFMKGSKYADGLGVFRRIAELCGHVTSPNSCGFVEASWVAIPAFVGAVLQSILSPSDKALLGNHLQAALALPHRTPQANAMMRAARLLVGASPKVGFESEQTQQTQEFPGAPAAKPTPNAIDTAVDELADALREKALAKVRQEMSQENQVPRADLDENRNETLVKEASKNPTWQRVAKLVLASTGNVDEARRILRGLILHQAGGWKAVSASKQFSGRDMLTISRALDRITKVARIAGEERIYQAVATVGGFATYQDVGSYLAACRRVVGRELSGSETDALVAKGRIYDLGS